MANAEEIWCLHLSDEGLGRSLIAILTIEGILPRHCQELLLVLIKLEQVFSRVLLSAKLACEVFLVDDIEVHVVSQCFRETRISVELSILTSWRFLLQSREAPIAHCFSAVRRQTACQPAKQNGGNYTSPACGIAWLLEIRFRFTFPNYFWASFRS